MKKPYISPVIETVEYEANSALCGSCAHNDSFYDDLATIADALGEDVNNLLANDRDGCPVGAEDFTVYCKFASESFIFIS